MENRFELSSSSNLALKITIDKQENLRSLSIVIDGVSVPLDSFSPNDILRELNSRLVSADMGLKASFSVTDREGAQATAELFMKIIQTPEKSALLILSSEGDGIGTVDTSIRNGKCSNFSITYLDDAFRINLTGMRVMAHAISLMNLHLRTRGISTIEKYITKHNPNKHASLGAMFAEPDIAYGKYPTVLASDSKSVVYLTVYLNQLQDTPPDLSKIREMLGK